MRLPSTKVFGGKRYRLYGTYYNKRQASNLAKGARANGNLARTTKDTDKSSVTFGQWALWIKSKGK